MAGNKKRAPGKPATGTARQPEARKPEARKPQAKPAPQDEQGEQDTTDVRMVNATHGATQPGDVITVDREEGAGIVAAGYGLPVVDGDEDDRDDDGDDEDDARP